MTKQLMKTERFFAASAWVCAASLLLVACGEDPFMRMYEQKKKKPYTLSEVFADGRTMRTPPEGAVPRERMLQIETSMPTMTAELLKKGKKRYEIVCATCHGLTGESDWQNTIAKETGSVVAGNFILNPAPSWHQDRLRKKPDAYYYAAIVKGFGYMPAFPEIPQDERWAVVGYIRALQLSQRVDFNQLPDDAKAHVQHSEGATGEHPDSAHGGGHKETM
jgi:mono/diheme cytochrome c family protein